MHAAVVRSAGSTADHASSVDRSGIKRTEDADADAACRDVAALLKANINPVSLLATDYLNHFNEAVMLLELVPDMADMLEDARRWAPKPYKQHFRDSGFMAKDLVCAAYDRSPDCFRVPFDLTVRTINRRILGAITEIGATLAATNAIDGVVETHCARIRHLIATAASLVNGSTAPPPEAAAHTPIVAKPTATAADPATDTSQTLNQDDIDALFR
jgi:hypothetical protein